MVITRMVPLALMLAYSAGSGAAQVAPRPATALPATLPAPFRAPYLPAGDGDALQEVPSTADPAVVNMRNLRAKLDAAPHSLPAAVQLADAYIDYSRQIGDAHYAGYAEAIIAPWTTLGAPPASALVTQATIVQYRHQFDDARALLKRALHTDPRNGQAWLTLATLDMVQGDYPTAGKDCAQVANDAGLELGVACLGNLRSYVGQAKQSLVLLHQAETVGAGASSNAPAATAAGAATSGATTTKAAVMGATTAAASYQAWVQGLIAESAERLGDWPLAERHYLAALKLLPEDNFLLVAYADFLLDRGRPKEVLPLLADHVQSDTAFLRLALAQSALHSPETARYTWIMGARFEALRLRGSDYFGREEARFALQLQHDPQTSLDLARRNWQIQKAPWDARVFLEAAVAAHQPQAAAEVLDFLKTTNLEDPIVVPLAQQLRAQLPAGTSAAR